MAAAAPGSFEQAGELKIGQVGIANLRVRTLDIDALAAEMSERVQRAPKLFARAAVVIDFGGLSSCPSVDTTQRLVAALREAGVLPVALAYGTSEIERLSEAVGLPLLAKFRAQYERDIEAAPAPAQEPQAAATPEPAPTPPAKAAARADGKGMLHTTPVRSGQQVYAQGRDLIVTATVGAGAEVIADGSLHVYGSLRGRALAGAQGETSARIFCRDFQAELVAIAGHFKVMEEIPAALRGRPVQVRLDGEALRIEPLE